MPLGMDVRIESKEAIAALERFERNLDSNAILGTVGQSLLNWIDRNFRQEGLETRWPPLSINTIASRRSGRNRGQRFRGRNVQGTGARRGTAKPLQDTGRLRQSFTSRVTGDSVEVGTQMDIAKIHHEGTGPFTIRPVRAAFLSFMTANGPRFAKEVRHPGIPRRPLIPSDAMAEQIGVKVIQAEIRRIAKDANRGTA